MKNYTEKEKAKFAEYLAKRDANPCQECGEIIEQEGKTLCNFCLNFRYMYEKESNARYPVKGSYR